MKIIFKNHCANCNCKIKRDDRFSKVLNLLLCENCSNAYADYLLVQTKAVYLNKNTAQP